MPISSKALVATVAGLLVASCAGVGDAWRVGWTERAADGQIMLVSSQPPTLGNRRLDYQSQLYPDLHKFLDARGRPDFLAETTNASRHYLVLYYLDRREAYAARTNRPDDRAMEFSGPYPITDGEVDLLGKLKQRHAEGYRAKYNR